MKIRVNIDIKVGKIVKYFVLSDLFILAGRGFVDPIFSVFIIQKIAGGTLATIGIATAIYLIVRSVLQIPIANYLDRKPGEKRDFMALIIGLFLSGFCPLVLLVITHTWELYAEQAVLAIAFALYFASWPTIFSRHLDKNRVSFDWSLDSTASGIAAGVTGLLGGIIAAVFGFAIVFLAAGILSFVAAFVLMAVPDLILPKPNRGAPALLANEESKMGL
jgi:MFS family permease